MSNRRLIADNARIDGILLAQASPFAAYVDHLIDGLGTRVKVVDAADISAWAMDQGDMTLEGFGDVAPPWPEMWIEHPGIAGEKYGKAVHVIDVTRTSAMKGVAVDEWEASMLLTGVEGQTPASYLSMIAAAFDDAKAKDGVIYDDGWCVTLGVFTYGIIRSRLQVFGPAGFICLILDKHGHVIGNRWADTFGQSDENGLINTTGGRIPFHEWILASAMTAMWVLSLSHVKNVTTELVPPRHRAKRRARFDGRDPIRYHVMRLHLPRNQRERAGTGDGDGITPGVHIVAGHRAHYGNCCPGQHDPNGLLFGKLTGVYWVPSFARGDARNGTVWSDVQAMASTDA